MKAGTFDAKITFHGQLEWHDPVPDTFWRPGGFWWLRPFCPHSIKRVTGLGPVAAFDWRAAEALRATDAIDCGHLLHMPTHLDIQVGDCAEQFETVLESNKR